jgi:hypothetical protein
MGKAQQAFEELSRHVVVGRQPLPVPATRDDGGDLRAMPDGQIVALETRDEAQPVVQRAIDRAPRATWD